MGPRSWGFESLLSDHSLNRSNGIEREKLKCTPEVMVTELAPNQQDRVRFLAGVPKRLFEGIIGFKKEKAP